MRSEFCINYRYSRPYLYMLRESEREWGERGGDREIYRERGEREKETERDPERERDKDKERER